MNILHICNQLGLGGTEKNIYTLIKYSDRSEFNHYVVALKEKGERFEEFQQISKEAQLTRNIKEFVRTRNIDLIHLHRAGWKEDELSLLQEVSQFPVIETNIFGRMDSSSLCQEIIDLHLLISHNSISSLIRSSPSGIIPHWYKTDVLYFAVDEDFLNVRPKFENNTVGRHSRADNQKWSPVIIDSLLYLDARISDLKFHVIGLTPEYRSVLNQTKLDHIVKEFPLTGENKELQSFLGSLTAFVHGSRIGETFGLAVAEAMMSGLPVVTEATPSVDNAQAELIDDRINGFVCSTWQEYAEKIRFLLENKKTAEKMGALGREKAKHLYGATHIVKKLEKIYKEF